MKKLARKERQVELKNIIEINPFITDEELAKKYDCSVQTIRLDRLLMGIPEVRERMKSVAQENYDKVRTTKDYEIVGELLEIDLDNKAISYMEVSKDMVSEKNNICRGHHIFAQANMLALSMVVISAMIGAGGLGEEVLKGITQLEIGKGFEGGLSVVILAMVLDRVTQALGDKGKKKRKSG